jgi:Family of unknown function (DUF6527)
VTPKFFRHVFVETVPERLEEAVIYISPKYATAVHLCACGCGNEVVTPFNPESGWRLTFDGKTVSLWPSIGNWRLPCQSHYFIRHDCAEWAARMSDEEIAAGRQADMHARGKSLITESPRSAPKKKALWEHLKFWKR